MAMSAYSEWLDQFEEGNATGGNAGEVEAIRFPAASPPMTSRRFARAVARRRPWLRGKPRADSYDRLRVTPTHRVTFNVRYSACAFTISPRSTAPATRGHRAWKPRG
jgi:hypothetical protein